ncbi:MAG TPA: hypothetical protein ENI27_10510 [bacterium]|nr:hypothetical protein [bacterium]
MTAERTDERVQILKSLRAYLLRQRAKFNDYLNILAREKYAVLSEDTDKMREHLELEQSIVSEIYNLQRVIDPLKDLHRQRYPERETGIRDLENSLENIKEKALAHNKNVRELILSRQKVLSRRLESLRPHRQARSPYADIGVPTLVDIRS